MATLKQWLTLAAVCGLLNSTTDVEAAPTYTTTHCTNTTTYAPNTTFHTNLNILFYYIYNNISQSNGYFLAIVGFSTTDAINGLFLCRADVTTALCGQCVAAAAGEIRRRCPNQKEALIWYDECMLRYTNKYFAINSVSPSANLHDANNISSVDLGRFNQSVHGLLNDLAKKAASSQSPKFAAGEVEVTRSVTLYGLEQCTNDLTDGACETCLQYAIGTLPSCCTGKQGARALLASCNVRYELYPFYTLTSPPSSSGERKLGSTTVVVIVVVPIVLLFLFVLGLCFLKRRWRKKSTTMTTLIENLGEITALESLQFNLATIEAATNQFSRDNEIGKGGFGQVYKGILLDGRQIAVKKLSKSSGQGTVEFKNEILLIAKLQHRNLVTLLGFCSEGQEKMLIYEYVPNKSLDYFLFDLQRKRVLNWPERYKIIGGIARGIHYLHEQSRLKVIHRDLKPSNVLLDDGMNPKISDFGLAKMVAIDQNQGNTTRIVGTYGYMSPEYAMHGQFSEKSDVFSFGVIILEIISTKRNARGLESPDFDDLLSHAWRNWKGEKPLEILDPDLKEPFSYSEVVKCIHIGLLCVQQKPDDRPTMERVVSYLSSVSAELPLPLEPAFFMGIGNNPNQIPRGESNSVRSSINDMTISNYFPR